MLLLRNATRIGSDKRRLDIEGLALDKAAMVLPGRKAALIVDDRAPADSGSDFAGCFHSFIWGPARGAVEGAAGDRPTLGGVEDNDVGVGARPQVALVGGETEDAGR